MLLRCESRTLRREGIGKVYGAGSREVFQGVVESVATGLASAGARRSCTPGGAGLSEFLCLRRLDLVEAAEELASRTAFAAGFVFVNIYWCSRSKAHISKLQCPR